MDASLEGKCSLKLNNRVYFDGKCLISITSIEKVESVVVTDVLGDYFVYINMADEHRRSAEGYWNGEEKSSHADDPLGTLLSKGHCWINAKAKVCYQSFLH